MLLPLYIWVCFFRHVGVIADDLCDSRGIDENRTGDKRGQRSCSLAEEMSLQTQAFVVVVCLLLETRIDDRSEVAHHQCHRSTLSDLWL